MFQTIEKCLYYSFSSNTVYTCHIIKFAAELYILIYLHTLNTLKIKLYKQKKLNLFMMWAHHNILGAQVTDVVVSLVYEHQLGGKNCIYCKTAVKSILLLPNVQTRGQLNGRLTQCIGFPGDYLNFVKKIKPINLLAAMAMKRQSWDRCEVYRNGHNLHHILFHQEK